MAFPPDKKSGKPKPKGGPSAGPQDPMAAAGPPVAAPTAPQVPPAPGEGVDPYAAMAGQISPSPVPPQPMPFPGQAGPMPGGPGAFPMGPGQMGEPDMDDNPMLMALLAGGQMPGSPGGGMGPGGPPPMGGMPPGMDPMMGNMMGGGMPGMGMDPNMMMGSDPYATMPGEPDHALDGVGTGDPQMGLQQMIQLLMLAKAGVGGGSARSSSGLTPDPATNTMMGMDFSGGQPGFGMY